MSQIYFYTTDRDLATDRSFVKCPIDCMVNYKTIPADNAIIAPRKLERATTLIITINT